MNRFLSSMALLLMMPCANPAAADDAVFPAGAVTLRFDPQFILESVAQHLGVTLRPEIPLPAIFLESNTPLRQFQDAMEPQWGFRPDAYASAYSVERNEIYLIDDASYYRRVRRTPDDSLAHEFVHYLQARYLDADLSEESCETDAIAAQAWFRHDYLEPRRLARGH